MRRNKSVKLAKKRQSSNNNPKVNLVKMEKDWKKVPGQMAALLSKQVKANKKNQSKLQKAVTKLEKLVHKSELKIGKANNHKNAATAKKQLKTANKDFAQYSKTLAKLNKDLMTATETYHATQEKHHMLNALSKHVSKFESEWQKAQAEAIKPVKNAKTKQPKIEKARKAKPSELPVQHQPIDNVDVIIENEIAEVA
jgi:hypothetical protein